jgi:hypothetical protein
MTITDLATYAGAPPGSGKNFAKLKGALAKRGAHNPGALAAYIGRKKYGRKGFAKLGAMGHSNQPARSVELANRIPVQNVAELMVSRGEGGNVTVRHRRGGALIGQVRRAGSTWIPVADDGTELTPHLHDRGALAELVRTYNTRTPTMQRAAREPMALQKPPQATPLMQMMGLQPIRLATPSNGSSDGPRMASSDSGDSGDDLSGLTPKGVTIYRKLCGRMPKDRAKRFAMRAQSFGGGK